MTIPPPVRNPFQEIMGLETILAQEEIEELKKKKINGKIDKAALADYMMTDEQY